MPEKQKPTTIVFNDEHRKMISDINEKTGGSTLAGAVKYALFFTRGKLKPPYQRETKPRAVKTPEDRAKEMEAVAEVKKKALEDKKLAIAKKLGAKIIEDGSGGKTAQWYTYWTKGKDLQTMPLMGLTEDLVHNQFQGNIKTIKKFHKLK